MIKCILFDMGGVILVSKIEVTLDYIATAFGVPLSFLMELRQKYKTEMWDGKVTVRDFVVEVKKEFSLKQSVEELLGLWEKTYLQVAVPNKECVALSKNLMKKYKVGLISNLWDFHVFVNEF